MLIINLLQNLFQRIYENAVKDPLIVSNTPSLPHIAFGQVKKKSFFFSIKFDVFFLPNS